MLRERQLCAFTSLGVSKRDRIRFLFPARTIIIDLHDERFNELVVEVADPDAAVKMIQTAL
jgi:hypothetical protein